MKIKVRRMQAVVGGLGVACLGLVAFLSGGDIRLRDVATGKELVTRHPLYCRRSRAACFPGHQQDSCSMNSGMVIGRGKPTVWREHPRDGTVASSLLWHGLLQRTGDQRTQATSRYSTGMSCFLRMWNFSVISVSSSRR